VLLIGFFDFFSYISETNHLPSPVHSAQLNLSGHAYCMCEYPGFRNSEFRQIFEASELHSHVFLFRSVMANLWYACQRWHVCLSEGTRIVAPLQTSLPDR